MAGLSQSLRDFWRSVTGQAAVREKPPEVILHDPGADRPHDLDDPFFDPKVQSRIGDMIATNAKKKS